MIVTFDPPGNIGGIEGRVNYYTKALSLRGHSVTIFSLLPRPGYVSRPYLGGTLFEMPSQLKSLPRVSMRALALIERRGMDSLILASGTQTPLGVFLLLYMRVRRRRTLAFFYGRDILSARRNPLQNLLCSFSLLLARKVAVNSRFTMKLLPPGLSSKYVVIYPSVGLEGEDDGNDFSGDPGSSVLFVGRLVQRKGVDVLISSLREVLQTVPDASLAVVGEGPEKEKLSAMARDLGISDRVSFLGILQGRELGEIFKESDVVVMPSRSGADDVEGFGTSLIEAGLFKKPVIGSKSGGIPEAVVDGVTGLLVPEDDSHALATALVDLLTDTRLREKMGEASYQRVKSEFRVEKAVSLLESALGS